jgi:hypothetical protein
MVISKELLNNVEIELEALMHQKLNGHTSNDFDIHCKQMEEVHNKLLLEEEESWRQKSRETWIKSGDKNTKFFHSYASF